MVMRSRGTKTAKCNNSADRAEVEFRETSGKSQGAEEGEGKTRAAGPVPIERARIITVGK